MQMFSVINFLVCVAIFFIYKGLTNLFIKLYEKIAKIENEKD